MFSVCTFPFLWLLLALTLVGRAIEPVFDSGIFADDTGLRRVWSAQEGGEPPRRVVDAIELPCRFQGEAKRRAVWDRTVSLDLSNARGISFELQVPPDSDLVGLSFYFRSGSGWYACPLSPQTLSGWQTLRVSRENVRTEGNPAGWDRIDGIRLAARRGDRSDAVLRVRNFRIWGMLGVDTHIAVVAEVGGEPNFTDNVTATLGHAGLAYSVLPASELDASLLKRTKLLVLPHHPELPPTATEALREWLRAGGRLLAFYAIPRGLENVTGIPRGKFLKPEEPGQFSSIRPVEQRLPGAPEQTAQESWNIIALSGDLGSSRALANWFDRAGHDTGFPALVASDNTLFMTHVLLGEDRENKASLLLAMVGLVQPELCDGIVTERLAALEHIGPFSSFAALREACGPKLKPAEDACAAALTAQREHRFAEALQAAKAAVDAARRAYCQTIPLAQGEFRAVWCHQALGVPGLSWDEAIARLERSGFQAVFPNMLWGGVAYYPSEVLPVAAEVADHGDQIATCLAACRRHGLQMHVWKVNWNLGSKTSPEFIAKLRAEGRLQQSATGEELAWLCPSSPENRQMEHDAMVEVARRYAVDGLHFDYIRYPDHAHCFCPRCRTRFESATGRAVVQWPGEVQVKGERRDEWVRWCQGNITALVASVSRDARAVRPGLQLSAAVFRDWETDRAEVMQDWRLWCQQGYLDFVCPMDYTTHLGTYESWVRRQKEWAAPARLVPGIGASSSRTALAADHVAEQIAVTRRHSTAGFIIFNLGRSELDDLLPTLSLPQTIR